MTIVHITDLHGNAAHLDGIGRVLGEADLVLVSGDITHFGDGREAAAVIRKIRGFNPNVWAVPGNCDYPGVLEFLEGEDMSLHCRAVVVGGLVLAGVGGSLPCPGRTPNEIGEEEFEALLGRLEGRLREGEHAGKSLAFVTHQPPAGTLCDLTRGGSHVGSASVRAFIERITPVVCFTGHIHEAAGVDAVGRSKLVNPGPLSGEGYALARITDRVEELTLVRGGRVIARL